MKAVGGLCVFICALFLSACSNNNNISMIKDGFLNIDKSVSIGYVLDTNRDCSNTKWSAYNEDGKDFVMLRCDVTKVAKQEIKQNYEHYVDENRKMAETFLKPIFENLASLDNFFQDFIFLINKDGTYEIFDIRFSLGIDGIEAKPRYSNNINGLLAEIYENKTSTSDGLFYQGLITDFLKELDGERLARFGLDIENKLALNERISANAPFGLVIGQSTIKEAYRVIPCSFQDNYYIDGVFPHNGHFVSYDNCSLVDAMSNLVLGFDDDEKLVNVRIGFQDDVVTKIAKEAKSKLAKTGAKMVKNNDRWGVSVLDAGSVKIEVWTDGFVTYVGYSEKEFAKRLEAALAKQKAKNSL